MSTARNGRAHLEPARLGFLSGKLRRGEDASRVQTRTEIQAKHFDLENPANIAKLDATEQLAALADVTGPR